MTSFHPTPNKTRLLVPRDPENDENDGKWRVSLGQNHGLLKAGNSQPRLVCTLLMFSTPFWTVFAPRLTFGPVLTTSVSVVDVNPLGNTTLNQ